MLESQNVMNRINFAFACLETAKLLSISPATLNRTNRGIIRTNRVLGRIGYSAHQLDRVLNATSEYAKTDGRRNNGQKREVVL